MKRMGCSMTFLPRINSKVNWCTGKNSDQMDFHFLFIRVIDKQVNILAITRFIWILTLFFVVTEFRNIRGLKYIIFIIVWGHVVGVVICAIIYCIIISVGGDCIIICNFTGANGYRLILVLVCSGRRTCKRKLI